MTAHGSGCQLPLHGLPGQHWACRRGGGTPNIIRLWTAERRLAAPTRGGWRARIRRLLFGRRSRCRRLVHRRRLLHRRRLRGRLRCGLCARRQCAQTHNGCGCEQQVSDHVVPLHTYRFSSGQLRPDIGSVSVCGLWLRHLCRAHTNHAAGPISLTYVNSMKRLAVFCPLGQLTEWIGCSTRPGTVPC